MGVYLIIIWQVFHLRFMYFSASMQWFIIKIKIPKLYGSYQKDKLKIQGS